MGATNHAYRALVDERIHQLLANRRWYRANLWAHWSDLRRENDAELRALLKIARAARKMGRETREPVNARETFVYNEGRAAGRQEALR